MHLDPQIRALRNNDAPQRAAQHNQKRAFAAWREREAVQQLLAEIGSFSSGAALSRFALLSSLFDPGNRAASQLIDGMVTMALEAMVAEPLGQLPMRHATDGTVSTLLLAGSGAVTLALVAVDGTAFARGPEPKTVNFPPSETWEHVLAGQANAQLLDCEPIGPRSARLGASGVQLKPGSLVVREAWRQALRLVSIKGCLVTLRLQRRREGSEVTREYRLTDGQLVHQAAGNPRESRFELAAALLGRMGRLDAAPLLEAMAQEAGSPGLRWQVLRECLALDTTSGFRALTAVARSPDDPLAAAAGALRAELIERYPVLTQVETCPT